MSHSFLEIESLSKEFGGIIALNNLTTSVTRGQVFGVIGPNGAGKTTLFNVITGFVSPDQGKVSLNGRGLVGLSPHEIYAEGVARTFQDLRLIKQLSVLENILLWFPSQPGEKLTGLFFRSTVSSRRETQLIQDAGKLLESVGLGEVASDLADSLSYGQQKLVSLACCIASGADLILLDEPVAGLAPEMSERVLALIRSFASQGRSVLLIEHNLDAVLRVCDRLLFMDTGEKIAEGLPKDVRDDPRVIESYLS